MRGFVSYSPWSSGVVVVVVVGLLQHNSNLAIAGLDVAYQLTDTSPAPVTDAVTWPLPSSPQVLPFFTWLH